MNGGSETGKGEKSVKGVSWLLLWAGGPQSCWQISEELSRKHLRIVPLKDGTLGHSSTDFHPPWQRVTPGDVDSSAL